MDLGLITTTVEIARNAIGLVKATKEIAEKSKQTEIQQRLGDIQMALNDLIGRHGELTIEFTRAQAEI